MLGLESRHQLKEFTGFRIQITNDCLSSKHWSHFILKHISRQLNPFLYGFSIQLNTCTSNQTGGSSRKALFQQQDTGARSDPVLQVSTGEKVVLCQILLIQSTKQNYTASYVRIDCHQCNLSTVVIQCRIVK